MALIIDLYSSNGVHERVNESFFRFIKKLELGKLKLIADKSVFKFCKIDKAVVLNLSIGSKWIRYFYRDVIVPLIAIFFVLKACVKKEKVIVIGFSRLHILTFIPIISLFGRFTHISVMLHSQLEVIDNVKHGIGLKLKYYKILRKIVLKLLKNKNLSKLVLSEHIINSLGEDNISYKNVEALPHPLTSTDYATLRKSLIEPNKTKNVVGTFGLLRNDTKNSSEIYKVARKNPNLQFKVVGRKGPLFEWESLSNVENVKLTRMLNQDEVADLCRDITHFIYLFPKDKYRYTASGSALDAILFCKNIIISNNKSLKTAVDGYCGVTEVNDFLALDLGSEANDQLNGKENSLKFIRKRAWLPYNKKINDSLKRWLGFYVY